MILRQQPPLVETPTPHFIREFQRSLRQLRETIRTETDPEVIARKRRVAAALTGGLKGWYGRRRQGVRS